MFWTSIGIVLSAAAVWTIPADLPGTPAQGAMMIVSLQGMAFLAVAVIRGAWFVIRNHAMVREIIRDIIDAH